MIRNRQKGFTLIELLIVVAIIGIIAAIAIPNLLNAIDRVKQKRTMADIRSVGTAVESYAVEISNYPIYASETDVSGGMENLVEPVYILEVPLVDGWQNNLRYQTDANGNEYTILSIAKDGVKGTNGGGTTNDFDCDIVFQNGGFFQWPEGTQT